MVQTHDPSHKLRRTASSSELFARLRVVHDLSWQAEALLFADGRLVDQDSIERSELLDGILCTEGETVLPVLATDFNLWAQMPKLRKHNDCVFSASPPPPQRLLELFQVRFHPTRDILCLVVFVVS